MMTRQELLRQQRRRLIMNRRALDRMIRRYELLISASLSPPQRPSDRLSGARSRARWRQLIQGWRLEQEALDEAIRTIDRELRGAREPEFGGVQYY
jgi:hypothetical protein